jgi:hypothetical protein
MFRMGIRKYPVINGVALSVLLGFVNHGGGGCGINFP